jgi:hypothetical protein
VPATMAFAARPRYLLRRTAKPRRTALAPGVDDKQQPGLAVLLVDASSSGRPAVTPASAGPLDAKSEDQPLMA